MISTHFVGEFEKSFDIEIDDNAIPLFQVIEVGSAPQKIGLNWFEQKLMKSSTGSIIQFFSFFFFLVGSIHSIFNRAISSYYIFSFCTILAGLIKICCAAPTAHKPPWIPYGRHYNPRLVYFLPTFWSPETIFQGDFFLKFCLYV